MKVDFRSSGVQSLAAGTLGARVAAKGGEDFAALLEAAKAQKDDKAVRDATTQLESVMLNLMWKEMRATVPKSSLLPTGMAGEVYEDMMFQAYADRMAEAGTGLGEMLRRQLAKES